MLFVLSPWAIAGDERSAIAISRSAPVGAQWLIAVQVMQVLER